MWLGKKTQLQLLILWVAYNFLLAVVTLCRYNFIALNYGGTDGLILISSTCSKTKEVWSSMALNQIFLAPVSVLGKYKANSYLSWFQLG